MTPDQIIREEFERWYMGGSASDFDRSAANPDGYKLARVQDAWITWVAAWAVAEGYRA